MHRRTAFVVRRDRGRRPTGRSTCNAPRDRVVIVGGGILGASLAYQLARRAPVTLLEKAGGRRRHREFVRPDQRDVLEAALGVFQFNRLGMDVATADRELAGELPVTWGGSIE
jgi:choline dehydrogenase-like flavoprotein